MGKKKKVIMGVLLLTAVFMSLSCAAPLSLKSDWRSSTYTGPAYKKVMVVAVTKLPYLRKSIEDEFAQQLKSRGVEAATCHDFIPDPDKVSAQELVRVGREAGIESYLVVRLLGTGTEGREVAPANSLYNVDGFWYANPVRTEWNKVANMESMLYDGKTSDIVWRATVDVVAASGSEAQISQYVGLIVKTLSKDKMIP
ncbi:MAG: hypothetical protein ACXWMC_11650 [Syntrophales bacterium]